ncbi:riboflavin biosynthesis protein RibF ['Fragaria x ananassa' phyllody phytoplasma]|uniref:Riboflavin biosynthesis protein n=1 Tax='Fragaria x ananassa' phyllody phytoplasma TaxID=2358428 RepID=A0ABS5K395_9MOLU|nr:riboflavin biosynthesis protein RibF ['Fragaria x ananassa' phyllody phytoplasma]MBS2126377.1 riboflavin biosynthesis protein RibF ['Fragaria x ananassa' phyllody phytoplasma]
MKIIDFSLFSSLKGSEPLTLAFGDFDGLHLGHQQILNKIISFVDTKSALINFIPNSKSFFQQKKELFLTSLAQKIDFYRLLGIDYLFLWKWNRTLAILTKDNFIKVLKQNNVRRIIITKEARFGYQRKGSYQDLIKEFEVCLIDDYFTINDYQYKLSTTYIKNLLNKGELDQANFYLGRPYLVKGKVISGKQRGRILGFPTANLYCFNYLLPHEGVYAVFVILGGKRYLGTANLGNCPTFEKNQYNILEVFIHNVSKELYDQIIDIEFIAFLRKEKQFTDVSELIDQIKKDILMTKNLLYKR